MTLWYYSDSKKASPKIANIRNCIYCQSNLNVIPLIGYGVSSTSLRDAYLSERCMNEELEKISVKQCAGCGWWIISRLWSDRPDGYELRKAISTAYGSLKNLDLTDISVPLDEVSQYLVARYSDRYTVHPKKFEEVVASVFKNIGYRVRVTSYSGDDGIDVVVLDGDHGDVIGVQVKRYKDKIKAEQIREFAGALMLNKCTKGIFVTTSMYSKGAVETAKRYKECNYSIELLDSERFYSALRINSHPTTISPLNPESPMFQFLANPKLIPMIEEKWFN